MKKTIDIDKVIAYVRSLQKKGGGFGATPRLPATVEDTFHAVAIFKLLAETASRPEPLAACQADRMLLEYIAGLWPCDRLDLKSVYQLYATAQKLNANLDQTPLRELAAQKMARNPSPPTVYYGCLILNGRCNEMVLEQIEPLRPGSNLQTDRYVCEERMMGLETLGALGKEPDRGLKKELIAWFQDCQTPDGGFGFLPGTTSFIENCHFCLKALAMLGALPRNQAESAAFIAACQTRNGGFGRRGNAAPFLDATYHAVASLAILHQHP